MQGPSRAAVLALVGALAGTLVGTSGCGDVLGISGVPTPADAAAETPQTDAAPVPTDATGGTPLDGSSVGDASLDGTVTDGCDGSCAAPCVPDVPCGPTNPCHLGITSCASGQMTCVDLGTDVLPGQACATYRGGTCQSGSCQCPAGKTLCSAACVDLTSDHDNCGACGHGCFGGSCQAGACQPFEIVTHTAFTGLGITPESIVSDGTHLYYSTDTYQVPGMYMVWTVPAGVAGGAPQQIVTSQIGLNNLALGPMGLYWSNYGTPTNGGIYSITYDGAIELWPRAGAPTQPTSVVSALQNPGNLVIDAAGTYAYVPGLGPYDNMGGTDRTNGYITQVDLGTGTTRRIVTGINMLIPTPDQVAVAGQYLYWLVGNPPYTTGVSPFLLRAAIADGLIYTADRFITEVDNGLSPVASDTAVFWLTSNGTSTTPAGCVYTLPVSAGLGTSATPLATNQNSPKDLVIDDRYAYWWTAPVDAGGVGAIMRAPLDASRPATHVADTGPLVYAIALDTASLYWTDTGYGIVQLTKPLD
jgi:hypothetical protein